MAWPEITVVVTARERFSETRTALDHLWKHTPEPFRLVYVDVNSPAPTARLLADEARLRNFTLVRTDAYVSPNRARNLGVRYASGEYVVFLDNDVLLTDGWLTALVDCAEETGAWAVGPLYLQGRLDERTVHMAGGDMEFSGTWGERAFRQTQRYFLRNLGEVPAEALVRQSCDIIEFHCALVRLDALERVGGMDEGLLTTREHLDFCLRLLDAGGTVWFEPASVISYLAPPPFQPADLPYFLLRWSDAWTRETLRHFAHKHGITPDYVERVAKTRKRRQHLVLSWLEPKLSEVIGRTGAGLARKALGAAEPLVNDLLVRALTPRGTGRHRVVHAPDARTAATDGVAATGAGTAPGGRTGAPTTDERKTRNAP
ncbi:glycosyltransferase [Streptomyces longwoodensis]|uniref:glycosyltransferase family 2 protein n=1 Tax=Streptomyces longwoodensis TaxID=68231 RepID=UPI0033CD73C3